MLNHATVYHDIPYWHNSAMTVRTATIHFLVGYEACSTEEFYAWNFKLGLMLMTREIIGPDRVGWLGS